MYTSVFDFQSPVSCPSKADLFGYVVLVSADFGIVASLLNGIKGVQMSPCENQLLFTCSIWSSQCMNSFLPHELCYLNVTNIMWWTNLMQAIFDSTVKSFLWLNIGNILKLGTGNFLTLFSRFDVYLYRSDSEEEDGESPACMCFFTHASCNHSLC